MVDVADLDEDERDRFEERAAIMEYDGGLPRAEAEQLALEDVMRTRARKARETHEPV